MLPPWLWEIRDSTGQRVVNGVQWTHPLADPRTVADERAAVLAYRAVRADRADQVDGLVCRVGRPGSTRWVEVAVSRWVPVAEAVQGR